mmetsp:Transcript_8524/g.24547  ORF Transcript_8524/g.24547 Transcript_8524/m.24547 type:complete len:533 (-) Transcript_8524:1015-2613(-)
MDASLLLFFLLTIRLQNSQSNLFEEGTSRMCSPACFCVCNHTYLRTCTYAYIHSRTTLLLLLLYSLEHFVDHLLALHGPFGTICHGVLQTFVARHTEHVAFIELLGQRDDVVVKEPQLAVVPSFRWVLDGTTVLVGMVHLLEQSFVPLGVHVPMLHGVSNVGGLDDVLDDDGRLEVDGFLFRDHQLCLRIAVEGLVPTGVTQRLGLLVEDVRCHDAVHDELAEALELAFVCEDALLQVVVFRLHQGVPSHVDGVLLGQAAVPVLVGHRRVLSAQLRVRDTGVLHIVDQGAEQDGELRQRIGGDTVGVIVQIGRDGLGGFALVVHVFRDDDAVQQLAGGHGNVRRVLKVVERVGVVSGGDGLHEVTELRHDGGAEVGGGRSALGLGRMGVELGQDQALCHLVQDAIALLEHVGWIGQELGVGLSVTLRNDGLQETGQDVGLPIDQTLGSAVLAEHQAGHLRSGHSGLPVPFAVAIFTVAGSLGAFRVGSVGGRSRVGRSHLEVHPVRLDLSLSLDADELIARADPGLLAGFDQ